MEDLAILLAAVIFNAGYAATRGGGGYNGTVFLISAGVLVVPTAVIAGMEGLCGGGGLRCGGGARTEKKQRQEEGETNC